MDAFPEDSVTTTAVTTPEFTWKNVGFTNDCEFDYWATIETVDEARSKPTLRKHKEYQLKDENLNMRYIAEDNDVKLFSEGSASPSSSLSSSPLSSSSSSESDRSVDLKLFTDPESNLCAVSYADVSVYYKSPYLKKKEFQRLNSKESVKIFCFNDLFDDLNSDDDIGFDPSEATFYFETDSGKKKAIVTIRSKAANALFVSFAEDPYSGYYQTL